MQYVIIDGLDASGKSTQAEILADYIQKQGSTVFLRIHPTDDCFWGKKARRFLLCRGKSAHFCSAFFYMCDVLRSIMLYLWRKIDYVIFVRYLMGTAYLPAPLHKISYYFFSLIVPKSEFMFFLDVTPGEAHRRMATRGLPAEMFESLEKLEKIRKKALNLVLENKWIVINADRPIEEIQREIRQYITQISKG